jgi:hypothetical protein
VFPARLRDQETVETRLNERLRAFSSPMESRAVAGSLAAALGLEPPRALTRGKLMERTVITPGPAAPAIAPQRQGALRGVEGREGEVPVQRQCDQEGI